MKSEWGQGQRTTWPRPQGCPRQVTGEKAPAIWLHYRLQHSRSKGGHAFPTGTLQCSCCGSQTTLGAGRVWGHRNRRLKQCRPSSNRKQQG